MKKEVNNGHWGKRESVMTYQWNNTVLYYMDEIVLILLISPIE